MRNLRLSGALLSAVTLSMAHLAGRVGACAVLLLAALALAATGASALAPGQSFGLGDQDNPAAVFSDPRATALKPTLSRYIAEWDVALRPGEERDRVDRWYAAAVRNRARMLVAFGSFMRDGPTPSKYRAGLRAFKARYPQVTEWEPVNEANHSTQPSWSSPWYAAQLVRSARSVCRRCTLVQVSIVLDTGGSARYAKSLIEALPRSERRRIRFGLHTYSDTNNMQSTALVRFLNAFPRGRVWITEASALARYLPDFPFNLSQQARTTPLVFRQAIAARARVQRLYWYEWDGSPDPLAQWDSGLIAADGTARPAYAIALRERFRKTLTRWQLRANGLSVVRSASLPR